jgi:CubicO group peptidase (beta-lactamase class C family)
VRRHAGTTVGEFARAEFAPDLWIGSPPEIIERAARLSAAQRTAADRDDPRLARDQDRNDHMARLSAAYLDPRSLPNRAMNNPATSYNKPVVLAGGWPAASMVATARDLAAFYRDLVGGSIQRPETLADALKPRVNGPDKVMLIDNSFGLGYMRPSATFFAPRAGRDTAFGHTGAGGAVGLGDVDHDLALAFIPNLMGDQLSGDLRAYRLIEAAYSCLG